MKKIKKAENNLNQVKGMRSVLMVDGDKESFDLVTFVPIAGIEILYSPG